MKFELKKISSNESLSQETPCFSAEIHVDGKLVAYVSNHGHGGGNMYQPAKGLTYGDIVKFDNLDVEADIFEMVYEHMDVKKYQTKGFYMKKGKQYFSQKFPMPISKLKKHPDYKNWLKTKVEAIEGDGYKILNTNL